MWADRRVDVPTGDQRDVGALEVEPDRVVDMVPISARARTVTSRMHHATGGDFGLALGESRRAGDRLEFDHYARGPADTRQQIQPGYGCGSPGPQGGQC